MVLFCGPFNPACQLFKSNRVSVATKWCLGNALSNIVNHITVVVKNIRDSHFVELYSLFAKKWRAEHRFNFISSE